MRRLPFIVISTLALLVRCFPNDAIAEKSGSFRGEVVTRHQNGVPAVLLAARIVLHGPMNKETQSDATGAFAIDGPPSGTNEIEANAPCLRTALTVDVSADPGLIVQIEMNATAAPKTEPPQLTWLNAMDHALGRKVHHA